MKKVSIILFLLSTMLFAREANDIITSICSECHNPKMQESCLGVSLIVGTLDSQTIYKSLHGYKYDKRDSHGMGSTMQEKASELSDDEIKALSEYIPTLR